MSKVLKRFRFARTDTSNEPVTTASDSGSGSKDEIPVDEKDGAISSARNLSEVEANRKLSLFEITHRWDPNLDNEDLNDVDAETELVGQVDENSPYPEVCLYSIICSAQLLTDEAGSSSCQELRRRSATNTVRAWVIGMVLTTLGSGLNLFFSLRAPSITITSVVAQFIAFPLGTGWAKIMPNRKFRTFGLEWNLNPGPFNIKEHTLIVVMANASFGTGVGHFSDTLVAQRAFYRQNIGMASLWLLPPT